MLAAHASDEAFALDLAAQVRYPTRGAVSRISAVKPAYRLQPGISPGCMKSVNMLSCAIQFGLPIASPIPVSLLCSWWR
jgi:hypothetical protein